MNTRIFLGGAVALSFVFAVGSASADDVQYYGATFESAVSVTPGEMNDWAYALDAGVTTYANTTGEPYGWFGGADDASTIIAATDKLYECWLLNCDLTAVNPGGALSITDFSVSNDHVSVTVQLVRQSPLGYINGELYLYGADDLAEGFYVDPISNEIIDFVDGDSIFDTEKVDGPVTQSVTATIDTSYVTEKFFKAAIGPPQAEDPWEDPGEEE
ncbi:MAG: hypothetical protein IJI73_04680 [Kiritimatiellae bacterium]|nr:hypothetical protein [Kiritimatiellia bacterium]